jgi:two-component system copper resistance phosphate regulon response regulator CusR
MRILIVEDEIKMAKYLKSALEEESYAVDLALTGKEALQWIGVTSYDVLVLDLMIPEIDGMEVCKTLRKEGNSVPIIMVTARDAIDDRVLGLNTGADDYLIKPFDLSELLARLRALVRRHETSQKKPPVVIFDNITIDRNSHTVKREGKVIDLTAKEYCILELFIESEDCILSRQQIAEHVWNFDVYHQSNVVDVHIKNLRKKLEASSGKKYIRTIRNVGYRFSIEGIEENA